MSWRGRAFHVWPRGAVLYLVPPAQAWSLGVGAGVALAIGGVSWARGSLVDSLLGATVQDVRWCDACARETERRVHRCGRSARPLRGFSWLGNDTVNVVATSAGALLAFWA